MKKLFMSKSRGFTLVELLIVIVIIGILAGVLIGVLNPIQQQNRAKDGVARSSLSKMALAAKSLQASSPYATNKAPTGEEFFNGVGGATIPNIGAAVVDCGDAGALPQTGTGVCIVGVNGVRPGTALNCTNANGYNTIATANTAGCHFAYYRNTLDTFRLGVRGQAAPEKMFVYSYQETATGIAEGFYTCAADYALANNPATTAGCSPSN